MNTRSRIDIQRPIRTPVPEAPTPERPNDPNPDAPTMVMWPRLKTSPVRTRELAIHLGQIRPAPERRRIAQLAKLSAVMLPVALAIAAWSALRAPGPDPHLLQARQMIAEYEFGKDQRRLNYGAPVYGAALAQLARVDPQSEDAAQASALRDRLERRIAEFHASRSAERARLAKIRERNNARDEALELVQRQSPMRSAR